MNRADLQARVDAARTDLQAAERVLTTAYGPTVTALARCLESLFGADELRDWATCILGGGHVDVAGLPPRYSTALELAEPVARLCADAGLSASVLRYRLLLVRPGHTAEIDAALTGWPSGASTPREILHATLAAAAAERATWPAWMRGAVSLANVFPAPAPTSPVRPDLADLRAAALAMPPMALSVARTWTDSATGDLLRVTVRRLVAGSVEHQEAARGGYPDAG